MNDLVPGFEAKILKRATDLYGDILPQPVHDRIEEEFGYAAASDADASMLFVRDTFREAELDTGNVSIRDNLGASFLAYLLEINGGINPLPPIIAVCGADIQSLTCREISASEQICR